MAVKTGISVKLDPDLIKQLNSIADREDRTLSNQISYFVKRGITDYVRDNQLFWYTDYDRYFSENEYREFIEMRNKISI